MSKAIMDLEITDSSLISKINSVAKEWAQERAAEMVGMRLDAEGNLVPNPNAQWNITEVTREELRSLITDAFADETVMTTLIADIQDAGSFSENRASMIARTEVAKAQVTGNYEVWDKSGLVTKIQWLLSADHEDSNCACEDNENEVVQFGQLFPSGDLMPPAHPHCMCVLLAVGIKGLGDDAEAATAETVDA